MSEVREALRSSVLIAALKELVDRDLRYTDGDVIIPCKSHAAAIALVIRARRALALAEAQEPKP